MSTLCKCDLDQIQKIGGDIFSFKYWSVYFGLWCVLVPRTGNYFVKPTHSIEEQGYSQKVKIQKAKAKIRSREIGT